MEEPTYDIQELVRQSGVPRRTIHFYVQQGLLPPPEGAGLAAFYTADHLLRLQMIPILRGQGLRLDDIRKKFQQMTPEAMRQAVDAAPPQPEPVPALREQPAGAEESKTAQPGAVLPGQKYTHYLLPGGVTVLAPAGLSAADQRRLARLLEAAAKIYEQPAAPKSLGSNGQSNENRGQSPEER